LSVRLAAACAEAGDFDVAVAAVSRNQSERQDDVSRKGAKNQAGADLDSFAPLR